MGRTLSLHGIHVGRRGEIHYHVRRGPLHRILELSNVGNVDILKTLDREARDSGISPPGGRHSMARGLKEVRAHEGVRSEHEETGHGVGGSALTRSHPNGPPRASMWMSRKGTRPSSWALYSSVGKLMSRNGRLDKFPIQ